MGALAPLSSWIPQDDLLLKNAVEAGASLESLAKGAVKFSRRFTVQELQDRWLSLLYDPLVSAEACAHMIEFEHSASTLPLKPNRFGISKENTCALGKRKVESVRKCYYAVRKRICNEPFGSMDLGFLVEPGNNNCIANQDVPPSENFVVGEFGDPISNHFGAHNSDFGTMHLAFPEFTMCSSVVGGDIDVTSHTLCTGFQNQVADPPMDHTSIQNLPIKELPFEADDTEAKPFSVYDSSTSQVNLCSGFGGTHALNSPISDCGASFHNLVYSSPLPQMPIWSTIGPTLPDIHPSEDEQRTGDTFSLPDTHNANNTDTYELKAQMRCDNMENSTHGPDDYLAAISDTLFNFTNEEELLYVDGDGTDGLSKSYIDGFGSLLLDSPNLEASVAVDEYIHTVCSSEVQILQSVFSENSRFHELHDEVICCMLNTEDSEIPCNDDVFLPNRMLSSSLTSVPPKFHEVNDSTSSFLNDFSDNQKNNARGPSLIKREGKIFENSCSSSDMIGSQLLPERGLNHLRGVKFEFPNGDHPQEALRSGSTACGGPNHISSATIDTEMEQIKHLSCTSAQTHLEKPLVPQINSSLAILNHQASHVQSSFVEMTPLEPVINPSEQEELLSESDDDVPYFSDVEAMILDMDLSPDDQDLYSPWEGNSYVSKYQHEDSKRAIIRLEQAAHSYMQRVIASRGAFAVLYGRRAKHFIKKPEVLVGRATEDVQVDIDLGSQGHASKISRRQAIIKMDKSGSFYLTNLGRCPIFVNNKEITPRWSLSLTSGCLVEIRGLPFIFETNHTCIKQYLDDIIKESKTQEHNEQL